MSPPSPGNPVMVSPHSPTTTTTTTTTTMRTKRPRTSSSMVRPVTMQVSELHGRPEAPNADGDDTAPFQLCDVPDIVRRRNYSLCICPNDQMPLLFFLKSLFSQDFSGEIVSEVVERILPAESVQLPLILRPTSSNPNGTLF